MSIIYGYIESFALNDEKLQQFNCDVLKQLPYNGSYICRDMFAMLPYGNRATSKYSHLIHFAAEYDEVYVMPDDWLNEFECLLSKLCWRRASAIETYSGSRFEWAISKNEFDLEQIKAVTEWHRIDYESYHSINE